MRILILALLASASAATGCYNPDFGDMPGFFCRVADGDNACPSGTTCSSSGQCIKTSGGGGNAPSIPKVGAPYTGPVNDPKLTDAAACPDAQLEPNNNIDTAKDFPVTVDAASSPKLVRLSICPKGSGDVDMFRVAVPSSSFMMAEIFYDISYGDLDVAILDSTGRVISSDGTSVSNGCTVASVTTANYYVAIEGANNTDVNRYDARIRLFSATRTCTTTP